MDDEHIALLTTSRRGVVDLRQTHEHFTAFGLLRERIYTVLTLSPHVLLVRFFSTRMEVPIRQTRRPMVPNQTPHVAWPFAASPHHLHISKMPSSRLELMTAPEVGSRLQREAPRHDGRESLAARKMHTRY